MVGLHWWELLGPLVFLLTLFAPVFFPYVPATITIFENMSMRQKVEFPMKAGNVVPRQNNSPHNY